MKPQFTALLAFACAVFLSTAVQAQTQTEPLGGQPSPGARQSVVDLEDQVAYQRAFEAVVWSQPAVGIYGIRRGTLALGMKDNEVMAMSRPLTTRHEVLTGNNTTPYILANADLRNGPVVLEIPAVTAKGVLYGQVVDAWQMSVADVGPSGEDKGKGGKYLFLSPGYTGEVPGSGYFVIRSESYRIAFAFRSIKLAGATDDDAQAYAQTLKMYNFADRADPKPTRFVDGFPMRLSTLPFYDFRYFEELNEVIQVEPVRARDKVMMGMLASLGMEPGKPFKPSAKLRATMERAEVDAYVYMQNRFLKVQKNNLYWPERQWSYFFIPDQNGRMLFETQNALFYENRSDMYHPGTYYPQTIAAKPATVYLVGMADSKGNPLEAGKTYKLHVPKDVPVKQFWALIVYDYATWAFIYNPLDRVGLSSFDKSTMKMNADGSVELYLGPKAPKGLESNWIPTQGKRPFPCMRLYSADEAFWDKSFKLPDLELVK